MRRICPVSHRLTKLSPLASIAGLIALIASGCASGPNIKAPDVGYINVGKDFITWGLDPQNRYSINIERAWTVETGSKDVKVAIVDSGVNVKNELLKDSFIKKPNGKPLGYDFVRGTSSVSDNHGHGTHVAGIIVKKKDNLGYYSGIADVSIIPVTFWSGTLSNDRSVTNSERAIRFAVENGASIINYSGGGPSFSPRELSALKEAQQKGILVVAAAGNEYGNIDFPGNQFFPCSYKDFGLDNIICVGSIDNRGEAALSSNFGKKVDIYAPGVDIVSTGLRTQYESMSGTSQATAFVTGVAALIKSHFPKLKPYQIISILKAGATPMMMPKGFAIVEGARLDAAKALLLTQSIKNSVLQSQGVVVRSTDSCE